MMPVLAASYDCARAIRCVPRAANGRLPVAHMTNFCERKSSLPRCQYMSAPHPISLPSRERVAVLLKARSARMAALHDWRFWRWRPKMTLLTLQLGALLAG